MKVSEKAYIAGMLDADGSISIVKHKDRLMLRVSIKQNEKGHGVLCWMHQISGLGNISRAQILKNYSNMYQWQITDQQAKKLLLKIVPFLMLKDKQAQIGIAFATVKSKTRGNHVARKHLDFYRKCREAVMILNASPTETERVGSAVPSNVIWQEAKELLSRNATVQPTVL